MKEEYRPPPGKSWLDVLAELPENDREEILQSLGEQDAQLFAQDYFIKLRREQMEPSGDWWFFWLILAGRGAGKNFAGSSWIIDSHFRQGVKWSAVIAPTSNDIRKQCVEGASGICTIAPEWFRPEYVPSKNILRWPDGGQTDLVSSDKPDRIRGGNYERVWWDELSYSAYPEYLLDMVTMTLRIGDRPRALLTMTPRPTEVVKDLVFREGKDVILVRGSTYDNRQNLSQTFINQVIERYEGTTLGRQELEGALLSDIEGALWTHALIDQQRLDAQPSRLNKVVIGVDPAATSGRSADETGIIAAGRNLGGNGFVLGDYSLRGTPQQWAMKAIEKYHWHEADYIVAESNQGGEMVREVIKNSDPTVPVKLVSASKGKFPRAQPIAHLYEQGRIFHCGTFRELEDEMAMFNPDELRKSPDRVDALVWAMTELMGIKKSRAGVWGSTRRAA